MLHTITKTEFEKYADLAYELALDPSKSGYPTYTDGIKTGEDFINSARKDFSSKESGILIFSDKEAFEGWIQYYCIPEDNYLSTNAFCVSGSVKTALKEFISFAEDNFKGYDLYLGFPKENAQAADYLSKVGFECIEDDFNNSFFFKEYTPLPQSSAVKKITRELFEDFGALHDSQTDDTTYWNSGRISAAFDKWQIYGYYRGDELLGAVYFKDQKLMLEIFGFDFRGGLFDETIYRDLLTAVLNEGKNTGAEHMTYFCEKEHLVTVKQLGFKLVGEYLCFLRKI